MIRINYALSLIDTSVIASPVSETETKKMAPWNSFPLQVIYQILGWLAFLSWSVAVYPQIILNFRRKRFLFFFLHVLSSFKFFFFFFVFLNYSQVFLVLFGKWIQCDGFKLRLYDPELHEALVISHIQRFPLL